MSADAPIAEIGEVRLLPTHMTPALVSEQVSSVTERNAPLGWWIYFGISLLFLGVLGISVSYLFWEGIGASPEVTDRHDSEEGFSRRPIGVHRFFHPGARLSQASDVCHPIVTSFTRT